MKELDVFEELMKIGKVKTVGMNMKVFDISCQSILEDCVRIMEYGGACNHIYVDFFLHECSNQIFWKHPVEMLMDLVQYFNELGDEIEKQKRKQENDKKLYKDKDGINHRNRNAYQENFHDLAERLRKCNKLDENCFLLENVVIEKERLHHPSRECDCDFLKNPDDNNESNEKRICRCMYYYQKDKCVSCQFKHKMELQNSLRYEIKNYEVPMKYVMKKIGGIDLEILDKKTGITYAAEVKPYKNNSESLVRMIAEILTYTIGKVSDTYQPAICFFKNDESIQAKDFCNEEIQNNPDFQYLLQYVQVFYITYEQEGNIYKYTIHDNREEPLCR